MAHQDLAPQPLGSNGHNLLETSPMSTWPAVVSRSGASSKKTPGASTTCLPAPSSASIVAATHDRYYEP